MNNPRPTIAIIGAGNGGRAFAAYLSRKGYPVNLIYRTLSKVKYIRKHKVIFSKGTINGRYPLQKVTSSYRKGLKDARIILIVTPASAHRVITKRMIPYLRRGQVILLNPGRTWGALEVHNLIKTYRPRLKVRVGETQTLLFTCRRIQDYGVDIIRIKDQVDYCFYPESHNFKVRSFMSRMFPELKQVDNIAITSLNNIGALVHPTTTILNAGAISRDDDFHFYCDGVTPAIARVIEKVDHERMQLMRALGLDPESFIDWAQAVYHCTGDDYFTTFQNIKPYKGIKAPQSLQVRYITEDVPTGLVPLSSLGKKLGVPTPAIDSVIGMANALFNFDFYKNGRTTDRVPLPQSLLDQAQMRLESLNMAPQHFE